MDSSNRGNRGRGGFRGNRGRGGNEGRQNDRDYNRPQSRGGQSGQHGGPRGGRGGGNFKPTDRSRMPKRPRMVPQHPINEIKLNEVQAAKIKEIDEEIKAIGKITEPPREEFDKRIKTIDETIASLNSQITTYHQQIEAQQKLRTDYINKNNPNVAQLSEMGEHIKEKIEKRNQIRDEIKSIDDQFVDAKKKLESLRNKTGFRTKEQAEARIDEIDQRVETSTLGNNELKKLLAERDRITQNINLFEKFAPLQKILDTSRERKNGLYESLHKINDELKESTEKRDVAREQKGQIYAETKKYKDQIDLFRDKIKELTEQKNIQRKEKDNAFKEQNKAYDEYRTKLQQKNDLEYQKNVIYCEAERTMVQVLEGLKKIGEIKERVNPHQKEIQSAQALIQYLETLLDQADDKKEEQKIKKGKTVNQAELALIASCKATNKKGKKNRKEQSAKAKSSNLTHSLLTISQFSELDLTAPTKLSEIPEIIKLLQEKVNNWKASFVNASVNFNIREDGTVAVTISLN